MNLRLDLDLFYCIAADDFFVGTVPVGTERPLAVGAQRAIDSFVSNALLTAGGNGMKRGAGVLVLMPVADVAHADIPGPFLEPFVVSALILENPLLNYGPLGTNQTAENILVRYLQLLHQWSPAGTIPGCVIAKTNAISGLPKEYSDKGLVGYTVNLQTKLGLDQLARTICPTITPAGGAAPQTVTLASATAGAALYYTTDGSTPFSSNSLAQPYNGTPITIGTACLLRVGAQRAGLAPSDIGIARFV